MTTSFGRCLGAALAGSLLLGGALTATVAITAVPASAATVVATIPVGNSPTGISSDGAHIWTANFGDNTVTEINASTGSFVRTIPVGNAPCCISSDGTNVWVSNFNDGTVTDIDASTGSVVQTIPVGGPPGNISSDGIHVWVDLGNGSNAPYGETLVELDASTGAIVRNISNPGDGDSGVSSDGTHVWVSNFDSGTLTEFDASTGAFIQSISVGIFCHNAWSDGTHVWVSLPQQGYITELDASTGAFVQNIPITFGNQNGVMSDGTHVWVSSYASPAGVIELNASDGSLVQTISLGGPSSDSYGATSDGTHLWSLLTSDNTVDEVDPYDTTLAITPGVNPPEVPATSPSSGAQVSFTVPTASDMSGPVPVMCNHASGSFFPPGQTVVTCTATGGPLDSPQTVHTTLTVIVYAPTPGAPVIGTASAGNRSATVTFTPGNPGGGPILGFSVSCDSSDGGIDGAATGATSPIVVSGLTNGKTYSCTVFAQNAFGRSAVSGPSNTFVPAGSGNVPTAPAVTAVTAGNGSALVTFDQPTSGSNPIADYTVSCVSSDGGTSSAGSGPNDPTSTSQSVSVSGLSNGHTYTCTVTATNVNGTSPSSDASASFVPAATVSCTDTQTCTGLTVTRMSSTSPAQTVQVTGTPTAPTGSVTVSSAPAVLNCPGVPPTITSVTTLTDTGFPTTSSLKATVTQLAVATGPGKVCYHSTTPFKSVSHPTTPKAGTFILLPCTAVANVAPCQVSSQQTSTAIIVKFLAAGGDPIFKVVVPKGRLVWPSTFPTGKVGTTYAAHLQSSGGKAPFDWKVHSGQLSPGLTLGASTGAITGKPTTKGKFTCQVVVTDAESPPQSATISVSITIT